MARPVGVRAATGAADRAAAEDGRPPRLRGGGAGRAGARSSGRLAAGGRRGPGLGGDWTGRRAGRSVRRRAVRTRALGAAVRRAGARPRWARPGWADTGPRRARSCGTHPAATGRARSATGVVESLTRSGPARRREPASAAVRLALLDAVLGQHDARLAGRLRRPGDAARRPGRGRPRRRLVVAVREGVVIASARSSCTATRRAGCDRGDGPALAFPDGFALYAWRGMPVPADFLDGLAGLTPERIREEENAELRRVMLETTATTAISPSPAPSRCTGTRPACCGGSSWPTTRPW